MADIDLKTLTPDTSLPTTGFLFGADSQASASPSVYSTQTVATTLLGSTSLTGATGLTTSQPVLDLSQTWNASGVTFTGLRFNAATGSSANSAAGSLLMDLQLEGASSLNVTKVGVVTAARGFAASGSGSTGYFSVSNNFFAGNVSTISAPVGASSLNGVVIVSTGGYQFSSSSPTFDATDTFLTRRGAANIRLGRADAAGSAISISSVASQQITLASNHGLSNGAAVQVTFTAGGAVPAGTAVNTTYYARSISAAVLELYGTYDQALNTASTTGRVNVTSAGTTAFINRAAPFQTLSVQSFTGTDIPGQPFVITGSQGTGTGAGGSIIFQVAPAGTTGSAQNALATALTIDSTRLATFAGNLSVPVGSFICTPNLLVGSGATAGLYLAGGDLRLYVDAATAKMAINSSETAIKAASTFAFSWTNASDASGTPDVLLRRDDANKLALRNGANAQTFRVYNTYTDDNNYIRSEVTAFSVYQRAAGTGLGNEGSFEIGNMTGTTNLFFRVNGGTRVWYFGGSTGHFLANLDNTYDIGASVANRPRNLFLGSYAQFSEMTAPAAPATNDVRIYAEDNGSGKTRLMARFATGAAVQIAIEP